MPQGCQRCGGFISWERQKKQFGQAMQLGISRETWKQDGPLCPEDWSAYVQENGLDEDPELLRRTQRQQRELDMQFEQILSLEGD